MAAETTGAPTVTAEPVRDPVGTSSPPLHQDMVPVGPPVAEIATLPPIEVMSPPGYPLSWRTGEPRRPRLLFAAISMCWGSVPVTVLAYSRWWLQAATITGFHGSARLLEWTQPNPVSALAIIMVILVSLIALLMVAAAGTTAFNAWTGQGWVKVAGLICLAVTGLSFLLNWWFTAAMIPLAAGVLLLWFPPITRFFTAMKSFRAVKPVVTPTKDIRYGPQPLI